MKKQKPQPLKLTKYNTNPIQNKTKGGLFLFL